MTISQATENGIPSKSTDFTLLNFTGLLQSLMMLMVPGRKNIARNIKWKLLRNTLCCCDKIPF